MYECHSLKRLAGLVIVDLLIFSLCGLFFLTGKRFFMSSAEKTTEKPVFLPVIMYHSVYGNTPEEYIVTPLQFESDMRRLAESGYTSVTAQQLIDYTESKCSLPEKCVMITFDDGCYNNLSVALPILEKYDMCAVVSVVGQYTDVTAEKDPHIPAYSYLTWDDIESLVMSGRIEIGNHTYNMHSLNDGRKGCSINPSESEEEYRKALFGDLSLMQSEIQSHTSALPVVFAYPFGLISNESMPVIRELGFSITLTCSERPNYITRNPECLYGINRYNRSGLYSTEEFMNKIFKE